jgi:formamidopyrimidine-DNA glycosylase
MIHLGMSGRLTLVPRAAPRGNHDHVAWLLDNGERLQFRDPRRFGLVRAVASGALSRDRRLEGLGMEPLADTFDGSYLQQASRRRRGPVKPFLMNSQIVVGVGNIYAAEALFRAGIHPRRSVARISIERWRSLASAVRKTLNDAIEQGGTTLNDFADGEGREGLFQVSLDVYGREGEDCSRCGRTLRRIVQAGRSTFYCPGCQH